MIFSSEEQAIAFLKRAKFQIENGVIKPPPRPARLFNELRFDPSESQSDAITYLCNEWDCRYYSE